MSSYITFYLKHKDSEPVSFMAFSRNNEIYRYINDNLHPPYIGNEKDTPMKEVSESDIDEIIYAVSADISAQKKSIDFNYKALDKIKETNAIHDLLQDISGSEEYLEILKDVKSCLQVIKTIVSDGNYMNNKILINVD